MDGIPGNVGGSLRMNAGAMGMDMIKNLVSVVCLDEDGEIRSHTKEELNAQYRSIPDLAHNFVLQAVFETQPASPRKWSSAWKKPAPSASLPSP